MVAQGLLHKKLKFSKLFVLSVIFSLENIDPSGNF